MSHRPFSNGGEYRSWTARNCDDCIKAYDEEKRAWRCDLEEALSRGAVTDGSIPADIAHRLGCMSQDLGYPAPRCPEFVP